MSWLFNLLYLLSAVVVSPLLVWRYRRRGKRIGGLWQKLWGPAPLAGDVPRIWIHAVSVGEVNLAATLIPELQRRFPDHRLVISTTTQTGWQVASKKFAEHERIWFPFDFSWSVRRALRHLQPELIVLTELEMWPNLLRMADRRGIPVAIVNGRLSERSMRGYRRLSWILRSAFGRLAFVGAQNELYAERFQQLGVQADRVQVTGNLKFDGASVDREHVTIRRLRELIADEPGRIVLLAGSTQEPEEEMIAQTFVRLRDRFPSLRLIMAPRHPERCDSLAATLRGLGLHVIRRSQLSDQPARLDAQSLLLIDCVGELSAWWGLADIAFVGGSFGDRGGQNMIEPAALGCAVCFGPNTWNFRDVVALLKQGDAAIQVGSEDELNEFVERCLREATWSRQMGMRSRQLVQSQRGATARTIQCLQSLLPRNSRADKRVA